MKKIGFVLAGILFFATAAWSDNIGLGMKLGAGENDPTGLHRLQDQATAQTAMDEKDSLSGLEIFYEWALNEKDKLGLKVGYDTYGNNVLKVAWVGDVTEETYAFPITLFYKRDWGLDDLSLFGGAGVTLLRSKLDGSGQYDGISTSKTKAFAHLVAGAEWRFTGNFGLGVELRYNIAAKVHKSGYILSDRSGLGAALTGRFYFPARL